MADTKWLPSYHCYQPVWPDHHRLQTHDDNDDGGGDRVEVDDGVDTDDDDDIYAEQNSSNWRCVLMDLRLCPRWDKFPGCARGFVLDDTNLSAASRIIWTLQWHRVFFNPHGFSWQFVNAFHWKWSSVNEIQTQLSVLQDRKCQCAIMLVVPPRHFRGTTPPQMPRMPAKPY